MRLNADWSDGVRLKLEFWVLKRLISLVPTEAVTAAIVRDKPVLLLDCVESKNLARAVASAGVSLSVVSGALSPSLFPLLLADSLLESLLADPVLLMVAFPYALPVFLMKLAAVGSGNRLSAAICRFLSFSSLSFLSRCCTVVSSFSLARIVNQLPVKLR